MKGWPGAMEVSMEYKSTAELQQGGASFADAPPQVLSPAQRLERWAELLQRRSGHRLNTLHETEYEPSGRREAMRCDNSPISVAAEDPVLRHDGLKDDTYGEAKRFFALTDYQLHNVLCYCHFGSTMTAEGAAQRVRALIPGSSSGVFARAWRALAG
jgi:hypothetical protein